MKHRNRFPAWPQVVAGCAVAAGLLTGCSRSDAPSETADTEIRGAPISPPPAASVPVATNAPSPPAVAAASPAPVPPPAEVKSPEPATPAAPAPPAPAAPDATALVALPNSSNSVAVVSTKDGAVPAVTFDKLASFEFVMPDESITPTGIVSKPVKSGDQIPLKIKELDQTRVGLKGFMLPLKVEAGLVTEMLIMRDQSMCCFGTVPKINEWVTVKMSEKGVRAVMDQPVTIYGKLHVGEMRENGYLVGIYRMDGEGMVTLE